MNHRRTLTAFVASMIAATAAAQTASQLPNYSKTPAELAAIAPTGGAGGSGNPKVQVVNILETRPNRGCTASFSRLDPTL